MKTLENEIRQDVYKLVEEIKDMPMHEQREAIYKLFEKYILKKDEILIIGECDFSGIISRAKQRFANNNMTVFCNKPLQSNEFANLCVIEATIEFLNVNNALRRQIDIK